jgi:hypothetical protein
MPGSGRLGQVRETATPESVCRCNDDRAEKREREPAPRTSRALSELRLPDHPYQCVGSFPNASAKSGRSGNARVDADPSKADAARNRRSLRVNTISQDHMLCKPAQENSRDAVHMSTRSDAARAGRARPRQTRRPCGVAGRHRGRSRAHRYRAYPDSPPRLEGSDPDRDIPSKNAFCGKPQSAEISKFGILPAGGPSAV